jgi:serine/threonine protein phosphatase PrpC
MGFKVGFGTDVGRKRSQNQDSGGSYPELGLFITSDGMGGHRGGETASATAVQAIHEYVSKKTSSQSEWDAREIITQALVAANLEVYQKALQDPNLQGMGTTTTALLFQNRNLTIGHVGDSRCYLFRPGAIWQLTRDHSLVQEKLRAGLITREELKTDKMKNVITRSVGFEERVDVETYQLVTQVGDCFMVCSDGLSGLVEDFQMLQIVQENAFDQNDPQRAVQELIAAANEKGGDDNVTAILIQVI